MRSGERLQALAWSQIALDQITWTAIVYVSGGASSGATSFYALTCLVGAILVGQRGAVFAAEKLDTAFHSIDELRAFVGGSRVVRVPLILTGADTRRHRRRFAFAAASVVIGLALLIAGSHYFAVGNEQLVRLMDRGGA